jgi:hypothetical protein
MSKKTKCNFCHLPDSYVIFHLLVVSVKVESGSYLGYDFEVEGAG